MAFNSLKLGVPTKKDVAPMRISSSEPVARLRLYVCLASVVLVLGLFSSEAKSGDCVPSVAVIEVSPKASVLRSHRSNPTMMGHLNRALAMQKGLYERLRAEIKPHCSRVDSMDWYRCASPSVSSAQRTLLSKLNRGARLRRKQLNSLRMKLGVTTVILYSMRIRFHDQRELEIRLSSIDLSTGATKAQLRLVVPYLEDTYDETVWPGVVRAFTQAIRDGSGCDIDDLRNNTLGSDPDWLRE